MFDLAHAAQHAPAHGEASSDAPLIADLKALGRFRRKMAALSLQVNVARMMFDRPYAAARISQAHRCDDASLRRLAMQLRARYALPEESLS